MNKRIMIEADLCTGCRYCEAVCSVNHNHDGVVNPRKARIGVCSEVKKGVDFPVICRQCAKPACKQACEYDAITKDPALGNIVIDESKCIGCLKCVGACPFGAMFFDEEKGMPVTCDLCGGDPLCVKFCRELPHVGFSALSYMNPREWAKEKSRLRIKSD